MSELIFEIVSATNYSQKCKDIFHKMSKSVVSWQSTDYAITPIQILFKLYQFTFVTEIYMHPMLYKSIKLMEIFVSDNQTVFQTIAKVFDFNDGVKVQISKKCQYIKFVILDKDKGRPASIDFLRIYGHQYIKTTQIQPLHSTRKQKIESILIQLGIPCDTKWDVDEQTLVTLHDISKIHHQYIQDYPKKLHEIQSDIKTVLDIGLQIKKLQQQIGWVSAKRQHKKVKQIKDQIKILKKRRDYFDQKYQTSRFQQMISMDQKNNYHDQILRDLLEDDRKKLQDEKRRRELEELERQKRIADQFDKLNEEEQWWRKKNQLDNIELQENSELKKTQKKEGEQEDDDKFRFNNPYVYNQGDADMQKHIKPLLAEFGPGFLGDPQLLRRYEQMEFLDVLGARIWVAAHSLNWRQRAAAVQAVLNFCEDELPIRYKDGKTRNLFLALMQFARINAEDKVLQIYYISLKIMTVALAPPICGDDVPPAVINKSIQKFINILVDKISQMNQRAKQISLKTMIAIFNHPVADISIVVNECLKICRQQLNLKFIPVDKQNPRIIQSRLQIISKIILELPKDKTKKITYDLILKYLIQGSIYHSHNDVRTLGVKTLEIIFKEFPEGTIQWYKGLDGLKPNISNQIQSKLKIK